MIANMASITVSHFKATCLAVMKRVATTREPVLVTRFGVPVVEIVPPASRHSAKRQLGTMSDTVEFMGDVVSPALPAGAWEVLRRQ
jgi:prevent-host-death family protein